MNKKSKGFTLIELLVVIAIIGILATIVLISLNTARIKARDSRRVSDIRQVQLALELFGDTNIYYPQTDIYAGDPTTPGDIVPAYMAKVPADPSDGTRYWYFYCNELGGLPPLHYHLGADLEESGAAPLNSDSDFNSTAQDCDNGGAGYDGWQNTDALTFPGTNIVGGGIVGLGADTASCDGAGTNRFCYDIAN